MSDDDCLSDLLLTWEEGFERGEDVSAEELCRGRPDLAPVLAGRILALKRIAWMKVPVGGAENASGASPPGRVGSPSENQERSLPALLAGRYRLDGLIGEGGFGQVWRGFDVELHRPVAVKVPRRSRPAGPEEADRFLAEARKVARLRHPGIVPVYDVGRHGESYFIVSELIDGTDLGERMRRGRLPVREAVRIVAAVASALEDAHRRGIVHRDIKPANVLLGSDGQVRLTDLGIALDRAGAAPPEGGEVCGTLAYMSPEQVGGDRSRLDGRSDLYSLGVMLCELVTGVRPPPTIGASKGRAGQPARPPLPAVTLPVCLSEVWEKCLATQPADRYATAGELVEHLHKAMAVILEDEEWAGCTDPLRMLGLVGKCTSRRKLRLFVCSCLRHNFPLLEDDRSRQAVETAERHAEGRATDAELLAARAAAWEASHERRTPQSHAAAWAATPDVWIAVFNAARHTDPRVQCRLLRELVGPSLYRSVVSPRSEQAWNEGKVRLLAQGIYDDLAFDRLPLLADALEALGCGDSGMVDHCRRPGAHVRGCWVVDSVLGKE